MVTDPFFSSQLLDWSKTVDRPMPWRGEKDPYLIWLSEIILQQTRVEQGLAYYNKFKAAYPTVGHLAAASEDEVLKLWEGLGYYSRARNMHQTAQIIVERYAGVFPDQYKQIVSLKGIGPYTAAAIASFAFNLPYAVVDGNVYRVLARIFGIDTAIDSTEGKKKFAQLAQSLLDKENPGLYNQAIMDFGATLCTPKNPNCTKCPFMQHCVALEKKQIAALPVKKGKITKKDRYFHYLEIIYENQIFIKKRIEKDIWRNLYEFPLIEWPDPNLNINKLQENALFSSLGITNFTVVKRSQTFSQTLSHQKIHAVFWVINLTELPEALPAPYQLIFQTNLNKLAFPKIIDCYLKDNSLNLVLF